MKPIVLSLLLGCLAFTIMPPLLGPALPTIGRELNATTGEVSWVFTACLLAASVMTPVLGGLGDILGKRRILVVVLLIMLLGMSLAGMAQTLTVLIVARILQGAAEAVTPLSIGIAREVLPPEKVSATIGLFSAVFGIGAVLGTLAAGPIIHALGWHWLFWLPCVLVLLALIGTLLTIPESSLRRPGRIDLVGCVILGVALVSLLLATHKGQSWGWQSLTTLSLFGLGAISLIIFVFAELRMAQPLIDIRALKLRGVWTSHVAAFCNGFTAYSLSVLLPSLLQVPIARGYGFGATATEVGFVLAPAVVALILSSFAAGILIRYIGPKLPLLVGCLSVTSSFMIVAVDHSAIWQVLMCNILGCLGIGLMLAAVPNVIIEAVSPTRTGEALSTNTIARTIGASVGTAVVAAILTSHSVPHSAPSDAGFTMAFWICGAVTLFAVFAAFLVPPRDPSKKRTAATVTAH